MFTLRYHVAIAPSLLRFFFSPYAYCRARHARVDACQLSLMLLRFFAMLLDARCHAAMPCYTLDIAAADSARFAYAVAASAVADGMPCADAVTPPDLLPPLPPLLPRYAILPLPSPLMPYVSS